MAEINLESSLLGFCSLHQGLTFLRNHGVLMRSDDDFVRHPERVMLISGGGAGHEPGQHGFVGRGCLSAAVSGNIFTSPSVTRYARTSRNINNDSFIFSCLAAILQANDVNREILLIINNYTGDRLNFGLAVEMARNIHNYRNVELLIVDDDCSIDNPRASTGRRGLAGIQFIQKIAGAMSASGSRLKEIYDFCGALLCNRSIRTIGFAFHHDKTNELNGIEIGYGIHGEPGSVKIAKAESFKPIIHVMAQKLRLNDVNADLVILFNNLGGASEFIFWQFVHEFVNHLNGLPINIVKVYAGKFLTSLCKEAMSVTIMEVSDPKVLEYLELPIDTPAGDLFNSPYSLRQPNVKDFHLPATSRRESSKACVPDEVAQLVRRLIEKACGAAINAKHRLNEMDSELGDGDTGATTSRGAETLLLELKEKRINVKNPCEMLLQISNVLMDSMGGTSGAIFSIFLQCASKAFTISNEHSIKNWTEGLALGIDGIMQHGKSSIGDRTLLDSLQPGYLAMNRRVGGNAKDMLEAFAEGCRAGAESTKTMSPKSGRSSYSLSDKEADFKFKSVNPDPGAHVVSLIATAISEAFA